MNDELYDALSEADLCRAAELLAGGADINKQNDDGESLLSTVLSDIDDATKRREVVRFMLDHGADPRLVTRTGSGPLIRAVIHEDTEVLRMLLDHGADPNREYDLGEPLYDYAEFHYRFCAYDLDRLPEEATDADRSSEEIWLRFLDRIAVNHCKRRPDYLFLLRERGALTWAEQRQNG